MDSNNLCCVNWNALIPAISALAGVGISQAFMILHENRKWIRERQFRLRDDRRAAYMAFLGEANRAMHRPGGSSLTPADSATLWSALANLELVGTSAVRELAAELVRIVDSEASRAETFGNSVTRFAETSKRCREAMQSDLEVKSL